MDENDYSSRDELDLELDGHGAIELSDSSDDEHLPARALPPPRRPHAPTDRVDEWRQTILGEGGEDEADDERDIDLTALSDDEEGAERDPSDPTVLKSLDQEEMDELRIPVQGLASALGGYEDVEMPDGSVVETYVPGDDCLGCLRDLRKLWRRDDDDPSRKVARVYAEVNLLGNDLIPIVLATVGRSEEGHKIALAAMDLITSMTWPVHVDNEARVAHEHGENLDLLIHLATLEKAQQEYKTLILRSSEGEEKNFLRIVVHDLLLPALTTPRVHRTERHTGTISMCMHLVRNLLEVRDPMALANSAPEAVERSRAQSYLVVALDKSNFLDVLLMLCSTSADDKSYDPWAAVAMECVYHLYIGTSVRAVAGFWHDLEEPAAEEGEGREDTREAERAAKQRRMEMQHQLAQSLFTEERVKRTHQLQVGARHPRFGTTIAYQDSNGRHRIARNPIALRKTVAQLQSEVEKRDRRRPVRRRRAVVEPGGVVSKPPWTPEGVVCVRRWADRFIRQGFTPLTRAMWVAIRGEHPKVGNVDLARLRMIQLGTWFLDYFLTRRSMYADMIARREEAEIKAERERQAEQAENLFFVPPPKVTSKTVDGIAPLEEAWDFSDVFEWTKPWALRLVFVRSAETIEFKSWLEFNAVVNLWTMLFRTMDALSRSVREEDRIVGEVAQEQVFYDREMLKQARAIMSAYKTQSIATLTAIEAFTYTMPKLLERFSQGKEYMYVRARDRAKNQTQEEQDDLADQHRAFKEQAFTFASFQRELATKPIATTAILYLQRWPDFTTDQELEMVVHVIHRLAIKCHNPGLFFGNAEREVLAKFSDPEQLAQVEAIAPKASRDLKKLVAYLDRKYNHLTPEEKEAYRSGKRAPRAPKPEEAPRELIVRGNRPGAEKLAIAAAVVVEQQMVSVLLWLAARLELALAARGAGGDGEDLPQEGTEDYELSYDGDDQVQSWASTVPEVWLLLQLSGLMSQQDDVDSSRPWRWFLPSTAPTDRVKQTVELLQDAIEHPFRNGDEPARKLLMRKPQRSVRPGSYHPGDEYVAEMIASDSGQESEQSDASASALQRAMDKRVAKRSKPRHKASKSQGSKSRGDKTQSKPPAELSDASMDSGDELAAIDKLIAGRSSSSSPQRRSPFDPLPSEGGSVSSPPPSGPRAKRRGAGLFLGADGDSDDAVDDGGEEEANASPEPDHDRGQEAGHDARGSLFRASASPERVLRAPAAELSPGAAKARDRREKEAALRAALLAMDDEDEDEEAEDGEPEEPLDKVMHGLKRTWERHMSLEERPELAQAAYETSVLPPVSPEGSPEGGGRRTGERKRRPVIMDDEEE